MQSQENQSSPALGTVPEANGQTGGAQVTPISLKAQIIQNLNKKYAVLTSGKNAGKILAEDIDPLTGFRDITLLTKEQLQGIFADSFLVTGEESRNSFNVWWQSPQRRKVKGIVFDPSGQTGSEYYNLWQGFAVEPIPGDCSRFGCGSFRALCLCHFTS